MSTLSGRSLFFSSFKMVDLSLSFFTYDFLVWIMFWMLKLIDMASPIRTTSFCSAFYFFSFLFSVVGLGPVVYLLRVLKLRMSGCFLCLSSYSSVCCFDFLSKFISLSFSFYFEMPTMWDMPSDSFLSSVFGSPIIELADGTCFRLVMCCIPCGFLRGSSVLLLMFKFK